ncbi:MAG: helix-turn-helix domain-containing protein [Eubacterium sp.]|nr:helix-turn-helix domain-containing protein [Eubacterium sp.]
MRFSELIRQYDNNHLLWVVSSGLDRDLHSVSILEGTEQEYDPGELYFGHRAQVKEPYPPQLIIIGTEEDAVRLRKKYQDQECSLAVVRADRFPRVFNQCRERVEYTFQIRRYERIAKLYDSLPESYELGMAYCVPTDRAALFPPAEEIQRRLERKLPYVYAFETLGGVAVLAEMKALRHDKILLEVVPAECQIRVGISNEIMHENRIRAAYNEAMEALDLGRRLWPEDQIYAFAEIGIFNLLRNAADRNELDRYLSPSIAKLQEYDAKMDTHLTETLHTYLLENGSIKETAKRLYLHRNTVIYRINKVRQITNLDLDHARIRFLLLLSFAAIMVREKFA